MQFFPIEVLRTDAVLKYLSNGRVLDNEPPRQDSTPGADGTVDYYKKLGNDDETTVDWRRKLGGMLMAVLAPSDRSNFILSKLPEGYVLWQHLRPSSRTSHSQKNDGHAAGGVGRADTYVFGHPGGKVKRYRSPQDFFPHLLWLATDSEGDNANCSCKWCSPQDKTASEDIEKPEAGVKVENVKFMATSSEPMAKEGILAKPTVSGRPVLRATQSPEQKFDSEGNSVYLYRPGELVWFNKGAAWGLSVICKRQILDSMPRYLLQPLSHPLSHPPSQIKDQESIRPWLAWSVPSATHSQIANLTFDQVPWDRVIRGEFGRGDAEVDGSILAAKAIDGSYTLFERAEVPTLNAGEVHYTGMFLGAEKVWVGEPVRLRVLNDDIVVMVILQMIENTTGSNSSVTLIGDIYKFVEMPSPYKSRKEWPTPNLPARMVADLRFRNEVSDNAKKVVWHEWRLLEPMARRGLLDVKGRWYETRSILPILRGMDAFQLEIAQGSASDASLWMNSRGDNSQGVGQRKKNRLDTLGRAVPANLKISRGLNGPPSDNVFPDEQEIIGQLPGQVLGYGSVAGTGDLDQYMNLDDGSASQNFFDNSMHH